VHVDYGGRTPTSGPSHVIYSHLFGTHAHRAGFKCVEALGRIIIRGPYPPSNAIIYMHLQL